MSRKLENQLLRLMLLALVLTGGCNLFPYRQQTRQITPVLPMSLTCSELTDHLNRQCRGLQQWRSIDTSVTVRMAGGLPQRLSGNIACQAPNCFRLSASNVLAHADLGANSERCWFYVQPGSGELLTWRHEDAPMVQRFAGEIPRIDPEWLLEVLGVVPLDPEKFDLSTGPAGSGELWLTAVSDDFRGRSLRRVIMVDTVSGMVREHAIFDHDRKALIRASLADYKSFQGHLIPQSVKLDFPEMDAQLSLRFNKIETNVSLPESLWDLPIRDSVRVVDLGAIARRVEYSQNASPLGSGRRFDAGVSASGSDFASNGALRGAVFDEDSGAGEDVAAPPWDETPNWDEPQPTVKPASHSSVANRPPERGRSRWWPW